MTLRRLLLFSVLASVFSFVNFSLADGDLLKEHCGYSLGDNLENGVVQRTSRIDQGIYSEEIEIDVPLGEDFTRGRLRFSCLAKPEGTAPILAFGEKTATEEIEAEDAGGRYARVISWQSEFFSQDWEGTIAHTNSILGDGALLPTADLFYICPRVVRASCFSLEIDSRHKVTEIDRGKVISMISSVSYSF